MNPIKGKSKETRKTPQEETDPNQLSDPVQPTADTVDLVSVIPIADPFLITKEGTFVLLFEIPESGMDIYGQTEAELCDRLMTVFFFAEASELSLYTSRMVKKTMNMTALELNFLNGLDL